MKDKLLRIDSAVELAFLGVKGKTATRIATNMAEATRSTRDKPLPTVSAEAESYRTY